MVSLALRASPSTRFNFVRKNYFYPDMPKNFQISQYDKAGGVPISTGGEMELITDAQKPLRVKLTRIQIEEDPGRLFHPSGLGSSKYTLVDYNRAGVGLLEIVTQPDLSSPREARVLITKLRSILEHLGVCNTSLEGAMRVDANISMDGNNRVEIKNISSYKDVERALEYEAVRQSQLIALGKPIERETRHWLEEKGTTSSSRAKEEEQDYRYFPEPDIPAVELTEDYIKDIQDSLPELPDSRASRFCRDYGLTPYDAGVLVLDKALADYFEETVRLYPKPRMVSNWIQTELLRQLNEKKQEISELRFGPKELAEMLSMIDRGEISGKTGKKVVMEMALTGEGPKSIVERLGLARLGDESAIRALAQRVFEENPNAVKDALKNPEAVNFLVGQIMKKISGRADPEITNRVVRGLLKAQTSS